MPKTKEDRRSRRKEGGELNSEPYSKKSGGNAAIGNNAGPSGGGRRGYSDSDRHQGGKRRNSNPDDEHAPCASFDAMNLKPDLLKGIYAYGFEKPSAIQQRAIKPIVRGRDVIAQSQSGTGKTVGIFVLSPFHFVSSNVCI